jgi:hypothetical protein
MNGARNLIIGSSSSGVCWCAQVLDMSLVLMLKGM